MTARSAALDRIVERNHVWPLIAAKWGVSNPVPPWKTSLDGLCDALDHAACAADVPRFAQRRDEEDALAATLYAAIPYPESQLVALAHSLLARGVIDEDELSRRLAAVRSRLEAQAPGAPRPAEPERPVTAVRPAGRTVP